MGTHYQGKLRDKRWSKSFKPAQSKEIEVMSTTDSPDSLEITVLPSSPASPGSVSATSLPIDALRTPSNSAKKHMELHAVASDSTSMNHSNVIAAPPAKKRTSRLAR